MIIILIVYTILLLWFDNVSKYILNNDIWNVFVKNSQPIVNKQ